MSFDPENPLDRMPGESKRAYAAFYDYAMQGAGARSMRRLLEGYRASENPITKSWVSISHWSANYQWVDRADRFDELTREKALAEHEARWRAKVMGATEVLGRLSEQAAVSIADFITLRLEPEALIIPLKKDDDDDEDGEGRQVIESGRFIQVAELNWEAIQANGHLIKSITNTKHGPRLELHDGQTALINMGRHHKLFVDQSEVKSTVVQLSADDMAEARAKAQEYEKGLLDDRPAE
jgi:hypothetical protein